MTQSPQPDFLEDGRLLFAGPCDFIFASASAKDLPPPGAYEVAFAGRSNVGKSSLLNALTNRNGLARTSNTPGRTQELNFFNIGEPLRFRLVDMPGYGFAEAPKDVVRKWRFLINDYLRGRQVLGRAFVLIDARHGVKAVDEEIMDMLDAAAVSYRIVITKSDKIKATDLADVTARTAAAVRKRAAAHPDIIATSSEKGMGMAELRAAVYEATLR